MPYLAAGDGPPLVMLPGLSGKNTNPTGVARSMLLHSLGQIPERFTVYVVNRRSGLSPGSTIATLADHYAEALADEFGAPVPIMGVSTGGSIALQLAAAHTQLVSRLVLIAAACRLSPNGRQVQLTMAEQIEAGRPRVAWAAIGRAIAAGPATGWLMAAGQWLIGASMTPRDPSDLIITIRAEDEFDASSQLADITAPTLMIGGSRDRLYSPELFRQTARGIARAHLHLATGKGHASTASPRFAAHEIIDFLAARR